MWNGSTEGTAIEASGRLLHPFGTFSFSREGYVAQLLASPSVESFELVTGKRVRTEVFDTRVAWDTDIEKHVVKWNAVAVVETEFKAKVSLGLKAFSEEVKCVGLEAGTLTQYLTYSLQAAGFEVVCMDAPLTPPHAED